MSIDELKNFFKIEKYHINYALQAQNKIGLKEKKVLEVGGSLPKGFVKDYLCSEQWICIEQMEWWKKYTKKNIYGKSQKKIAEMNLINITSYENLSDYQIIEGKIEDLPECLYNCFDVIFSIAAFEHLTNFPLALYNMLKALVKGGILFSMFAPIWSAHNGHHLPTIIDKSGREIDFGHSPIPPWGHLLMRPPVLYKYLLDYTDTVTASNIVNKVYHSSHINRLFVEDYLDYIDNSDFNKLRIELFDEIDVYSEIQKQLETLHPGRKYFGNNGIMIILQK